MHVTLGRWILTCVLFAASVSPGAPIEIKVPSPEALPVSIFPRSFSAEDGATLSNKVKKIRSLFNQSLSSDPTRILVIPGTSNKGFLANHRTPINLPTAVELSISVDIKQAPKAIEAFLRKEIDEWRRIQTKYREIEALYFEKTGQPIHVILIGPTSTEADTRGLLNYLFAEINKLSKTDEVKSPLTVYLHSDSQVYHQLGYDVLPESNLSPAADVSGFDISGFSVKSEGNFMVNSVRPGAVHAQFIAQQIERFIQIERLKNQFQRVNFEIHIDDMIEAESAYEFLQRLVARGFLSELESLTESQRMKLKDWLFVMTNIGGGFMEGEAKTVYVNVENPAVDADFLMGFDSFISEHHQKYLAAFESLSENPTSFVSLLFRDPKSIYRGEVLEGTNWPVFLMNDLIQLKLSLAQDEVNRLESSKVRFFISPKRLKRGVVSYSVLAVDEEGRPIENVSRMGHSNSPTGPLKDVVHRVIELMSQTEENPPTGPNVDANSCRETLKN